MVMSSQACSADWERTPQEKGCLSKRIYCSCSAFLCMMAAALGTTGQREVNKPSTQKAKQKSKCLTRSILLLPVQNQSKVRLKKDRYARIDGRSMYEEERGFDKMADFVENGTSI